MATSLASAADETSSMQQQQQQESSASERQEELMATNTITDIRPETSATTAQTMTMTMMMTPPPTPPSPKLAATTTRIPHPSLTDGLSPFQRSSSMRVRGTKSNLLSNETARYATPAGGNNKNNNNTSSLTSSSLLANVAGSHEFGTTGAFSSRRKVALRSSPVRALNQTTNSTLFAGHLARASSLQRNYRNSGHKTAALKQSTTEHASSTAITTSSESTLCAPSAEANKELALDLALDLHGKGEHNNEEALFDVNNMAASATTEAEVEAVELKARNLSLKLNGGGNTGTTAAAAAATTTITTVGQASIVNGINSLSSTTTTTPKTPKTPLGGSNPNVPLSTQPLQQQQHTCIRQGHCGKKYTGGIATTSTPTSAVIIAAGKLATVPETKLSPKTPPVTPDSPSTYLDDDLDSMYSFATTTSGRSTMSCEHPYVARNGTTFSGRKMKYVVHCSNYAGQVGSDYLTPTQRAQRQIKRLKELLCIARQDLEQKDTEILRLTREVVELRLFKASLSSPEERSASSDAVTVREAELKTSQDVSPIVDMSDDAAKASPRHMARLQQQHQQLQQQHAHTSSAAMQMSTEMQSSFADSGHFEDITTSSLHSKDSHTATHEDGAGDELGEHADVTDNASGGGGNSLEGYELQRQELIRMYEQRIEELIRTQDTATSDMKRSHNDKVEALLQKLAECNTRYADIVPDYEHAKERIRELEKQLEDLQRKLVEHEEKQNKMYLHMYQKGQEAERIARADQALELAHRQPESKVSINELLHQLQSTQDELENIRTIYRRLLEAQKNRTHVDPEVTLQFLKSAVYYFLTDKENSHGHLQAIESILEFTEAEKQNISKARTAK